MTTYPDFLGAALLSLGAATFIAGWIGSGLTVPFAVLYLVTLYLAVQEPPKIPVNCKDGSSACAERHYSTEKK